MYEGYDALYGETESALWGDGDDYQERIRPKLLRLLQAVGRDRPLKLNPFPIGRHEKRFLSRSRLSTFHQGVEMSPGSLLADSIPLCK